MCGEATRGLGEGFEVYDLGRPWETTRGLYGASGNEDNLPELICRHIGWFDEAE